MQKRNRCRVPGRSCKNQANIGKKVKFTISRAPNQSQLGFTGGNETITNMVKCSKIDAEDVGSDLQNDSRIDIVVDSSDTALDKGNSDTSEIMDMESIDNGADNSTSAPDTTEIVDNGANSDIVHSTYRDMSISVVIDNRVPEKSLKSAITDNGAPDQSDIVDGAHNSSLDSGTCLTSSDIEESPQQPILKCYDPKKFGSESFTNDIHG